MVCFVTNTWVEFLGNVFKRVSLLFSTGHYIAVVITPRACCRSFSCRISSSHYKSTPVFSHSSSMTCPPWYSKFNTFTTLSERYKVLSPLSLSKFVTVMLFKYITWIFGACFQKHFTIILNPESTIVYFIWINKYAAIYWI